MAASNIAANLKRLRSFRGFTQEQIAEKAGISRAAYRNIETGKAEPRVSNLQAIALALEISVERLLAPVQTLRAVRFRSSKRMRSREQILVDVSRWLDDFAGLEDLLDDHIDYRLDVLRKGLGRRRNRGEAAALLARETFGLNAEEPVRDICGLLDSRGIKVWSRPVATQDFFGLSVAAQEGGPAVIVNTWDRISVERWIFTAAHELGHLVLHLSEYDVDRTEEEEKHEAEANAFASAFLMPDASFQKEWKETRGLALIDRVLKVKRIFRVSYRTVLFRLAPTYRGPKNIWARFQGDCKRRYGRTLLRDDEPAALAEDAFSASFPETSSAGEPDHISPVDFTQDRLSGLVRRAVEEEKISLGRGAEILGLSLHDMRDLSASWIG